MGGLLIKEQLDAMAYIKKNDMLNALRFLVEYTGTALLSSKLSCPGKGNWEERPENLEPKDYFS